MQLDFGFEINKILGHEIKKEKAKTVFANLDEASLYKVMSYCYANTSFKCYGAVECYYCTIIKFVNEEFRIRERIRAKMDNKS